VEGRLNPEGDRREPHGQPGSAPSMSEGGAGPLPRSALVIYSFSRLWSLGTGKGSPDFFHALCALTGAVERVTLVHPRRGESPIAAQVPPGVRTVAFRDPRVPEIPSPGGWILVRAAVFGLNCPVRWLNYLLFNIAAHRAAAREPESVSPDLVTAHGATGTWAAARIARRTGARYLVRLFGVSLGMKGIRHPAILGQIDEVVALRTPADLWLIADDGSGGRAAALRMGAPPDRVRMQRPTVSRDGVREVTGTERAEFRRGLGLAPNTRVILRVCRLWIQQRVDRMIEALPRTAADGNPVAAVIVGDGPERPALEALARRLGKHVIFLGAQSNDGLAMHYLASDLYVATADRTNLAQSVLEAMCHGLSVVAIASGETGGLIRDRENGLLVPPGDPGALAARIREALDDAALRERLGRAAMRTAELEIPDVAGRIAAETDLIRKLLTSGTHRA